MEDNKSIAELIQELDALTKKLMSALKELQAMKPMFGPEVEL